MIFLSLDDDVRTSFLAAYELTEDEVLTRSESEMRSIAANQPVAEAFYDALLLRRAMVGVYSADTQSEYARDTEVYDRVATRINNTYGDIVVTSAEAKGGALGLRGHRVPPFASITYGSRDGVTRFRNLAEEVAEEDRIVRDRADDASSDG